MIRRLLERAPPWARPALAAAGVLAGAAAALWLALRFWPYPELAAFRERPYSLEVLDRSGGVLAVLPVAEGVRRQRVRLAELPPEVAERFVEAEDRRFYFHPGVDPLALVRAAAQSLAAGRIVSGASTISMQLASLASPRPAGLGGKLAEMVDALRLEARLSKREILELYLSNLPYGRGAEGVASAAWAYFAKPASALTAYEAAVLAVLPRGPSRYDPALAPDALAAAAARSFAGTALAAGADRASLAAAFAACVAGSVRGRYENRAPHFLRDAVLPAAPAGADRIRTSLDSRIQLLAETAARDCLSGWESARLDNAAVLVLDAHSGEILAWLGSVDFWDEAGQGQIDGVLSGGNPGSTLKPFLYALALDSGFTPATVLPDVPTEFGAGSVYIPLNFNNRYNGPVRLRVALASSLNVPAVYTLNRLGVQNFVDFLLALGFGSLEGQRGSVGVGLALGNASVSLLELTRAFAVFVRDGRPLETTALAAVPAAAAGNPAAGAGPAAPAPMSRYAAQLVRSMLSDPASRFAGFAEGRTFAVDYDAIFKTGTANQYQHVWALGATADYVVGVWMGNFRGETVIGRTGSAIPAQAVVRVLDALATPGKRFPPLEDVAAARICALSGQAAGPACPAAVDEYFRPGAEPAPCSWHRPDGRTAYPPEYAAWLGAGRRFGTATASADAPEIVRPAEGAVFFFDPGRPAADQALVIQVVNADAPGVAVSHDGRPLGPGKDGKFLVPARVGAHVVAVERDGVTMGETRYTVR